MKGLDGTRAKTILVTGAGGFLGSQLIYHLDCLGKYDVFALTSQKDMLLKRFQEYKHVTIFDIKEWKKNEIPFNSIDVLVHCAFTRKSEGRLISDSLDFTNMLIKSAVKSGVRAIMNISSQSVYSQLRKMPAKESTPIVPESLYAVAKYSSELLINNICKNEGIPFTNIRLASLTGIGLDARLTTRFIKSAIKGEIIKIFGGKQIISYMDVRDAAEGILALISKETRKWKEVYNLGVEESYSIIEIADMIKRIAPQYISLPVIIELENKDVFLNLSMDCTRFYRDASWRPKYNMKKIIETQFKHFKLKEESSCSRE